jgi:transposase
MAMAKGGRRATYEERLSICRLIESGESPNQVVKKSGFGRSTVFGWWQAYRRSGPEALRTKRTPGPAANLNERQLAELRALIVDAGRRGTYDGGRLWSRKRVGEIIDSVFDVRLSPVSIGRVLSRIGISLADPLTRFKTTEPAASWPDGVPAALGAEARRAGAAVYHVWWEPLTPERGAAAGDAATSAGDPHGFLLFCAGGAHREVRFRSVIGGTEDDAFIQMCEALLREESRPVVIITESSDATRSQKTVRFFASTNGRLSLLLLATNTDIRRERTEGREDDFWRLTLHDPRRAVEDDKLVVVSSNQELDDIEHELVLRLFRRRLDAVLGWDVGAEV